MNDVAVMTAKDIGPIIGNLAHNKDRWARANIEERLRLLDEMRACTYDVAAEWAELAATKKGIPGGSPLVGEEWLSGPYALLSACNALMATLEGLDDKRYLDKLRVRKLENGQLAVRVLPATAWDRLLLNGVTADVWMQAGVDEQGLRRGAAAAYATPAESRNGSVALVLGAGNISSIAPLDCLHKLYSELAVVILKLNPVNDYLYEILGKALRPLIEYGVLAIVKGGVEVGEYLCRHDQVDSIHITGAGTSHDAIVWGSGEEGIRNKRAGTPRIGKPITSELGAVCPTIVVPGPWSEADIRFQAEQVATQKLHNSGFNCVACQVLVLPANWNQVTPFVDAVKSLLGSVAQRALYYPGADERIDGFLAACPDSEILVTGEDGVRRIVASCTPGDAGHPAEQVEVFAPALSMTSIGGEDAETFLRDAIAYCNDRLHGTLGANILIHPATRRQLAARWNDIVGELRYGCIAINGWSGIGFLTVQTPWGAFPGHTLDDVQSGIGFVHNTYMLGDVERTIVEAPFRPFPRNLLHGSFSLLPKPPWFVTNRMADRLGRKLTEFQFRPTLAKLPGIFFDALRG